MSNKNDGSKAGGGEKQPDAAKAPTTGSDGVDYEQRVERMISRASGNVSATRERKSTGSGHNILDEGQTVHQRDAAAARVLSISRHLVTEAPRQTPVLATCDVLVVGGGPAGLSAALGARRAGADVILMDRFGCFGGVITTVGMETLGWYVCFSTAFCSSRGVHLGGADDAAGPF
jgi:NADPH-dependent 2,4-dienoyl-CoA reductase/sulfur reductase-like enzyme